MDVVEKPEQNRFELALDGGTALVAYRRDGERLVLVHTEVPQQFAGQGVGSRPVSYTHLTLPTKCSV